MLSFRMQMKQFNFLLDMCPIHCPEVQAVSLDEAATFTDATIVIVPEVACSFKLSRLQ